MSRQKSQSALEYMMTYGWAILIIVIVAGVLYSLGIFNPSASSSQGANVGFSGFQVTQQCFTNQTLIVLITNQLGSAINITSVNITNPSASKKLNIILTPSASATVGFAGVCPSIAGSSYSIQTYIYYTFASSPFSSVTSSVGYSNGKTAVAPIQVVKPTGITSYAQVSITNSQTSPTPINFQQLVNISLSSYIGHINSSTGATKAAFQNVEFFNGTTGSVIPSWLENYSFSKNYALYWLNLSNGVPASSTIASVYVGFASNTTNLFNTNTVGEAPELSATYGQYDNGAQLFKFYDNFAGSSLSAKWTVSGSWTYSVSNKISVTASPGSGDYISSSTSFAYPMVVDFYGTDYTSALAMVGVGTSGCTACSNAAGIYITGQADLLNIGAASGSSSTGSSDFPTVTGALTYTVEVVSTSQAYGYSDYGSVQSVTQDIPASPQPVMAFGEGGAAQSYSPAVFLYWIRVRAYPPSNTMPAVSLGALE